MAKFDGIRMKDLVKVEDPDGDGGITLTFKDGGMLKIRLENGSLVSESIPE